MKLIQLQLTRPVKPILVENNILETTTDAGTIEMLMERPRRSSTVDGIKVYFYKLVLKPEVNLRKIENIMIMKKSLVTNSYVTY